MNRLFQLKSDAVTNKNYLNTLSLHKAENISSTTKSSWILFCTFYSLAEVRINVLMMIQLILVQSPHIDFNINDSLLCDIIMCNGYSHILLCVLC